MDFKDNAIEINLGTCWSPVNEDDSFDAIVFKGQGIDQQVQKDDNQLNTFFSNVIQVLMYLQLQKMESKIVVSLLLSY